LVVVFCTTVVVWVDGEGYTKREFSVANTKFPHYDINNNLTGKAQHIILVRDDEYEKLHNRVEDRYTKERKIARLDFS
jgi:hypothetical protein